MHQSVRPVLRRVLRNAHRSPSARYRLCPPTPARGARQWSKRCPPVPPATDNSSPGASPVVPSKKIPSRPPQSLLGLPLRRSAVQRSRSSSGVTMGGMMPRSGREKRSPWRSVNYIKARFTFCQSVSFFDLWLYVLETMRFPGGSFLPRLRSLQALDLRGAVIVVNRPPPQPLKKPRRCSPRKLQNEPKSGLRSWQARSGRPAIFPAIAPAELGARAKLCRTPSARPGLPGAARGNNVVHRGQRCTRHPVRRRLPAAPSAHGAADLWKRPTIFSSPARPALPSARPSTRLPAQDQRLRRLDARAVRTVHPRPGRLRNQRHRTDPAAFRRRRRQPAFPAAQDRHDGRDVADLRRVRHRCLDLVSGDGQRLFATPRPSTSRSRNGTKSIRRLPRIDAIFVPGGDPGHTRPKYLMALLEKQTAVAAQVPSQGADVDVAAELFHRMDGRMVRHLMNQQPAWLSGVVFGPQVRVSLPELRAKCPRNIPIRRYPDITHSRHSQYPVPDWDLAFASTEGREVINPRPTHEAAHLPPAMSSTRSAS